MVSKFLASVICIEPSNDSSLSCSKVLPDIFLVPMVAFDFKRNRLGYGGGYYDTFIKKINKIKKNIKIGLAFSIQRIKKIPMSKHDQSLDYVVTDKYIL